MKLINGFGGKFTLSFLLFSIAVCTYVVYSKKIETCTNKDIIYTVKKQIDPAYSEAASSITGPLDEEILGNKVTAESAKFNNVKYSSTVKIVRTENSEDGKMVCTMVLNEMPISGTIALPVNVVTYKLVDEENLPHIKNVPGDHRALFMGEVEEDSSGAIKYSKETCTQWSEAFNFMVPEFLQLKGYCEYKDFELPIKGVKSTDLTIVYKIFTNEISGKTMVESKIMDIQ